MALTQASSDVNNHISFTPDEKMYFINVQHETVLKSLNPKLNSSCVCSQ